VIDQYFSQLGLDRGFFPVLLVMNWVERALGRLERQIRAGVSPAAIRSSNIYVAYVSALASARAQLFTQTHEN
jgi:hypothetical protein